MIESRKITEGSGKLGNLTAMFAETDESSYSLRPIGMLSMYSCFAPLSFVCFLRPGTLALVSFGFSNKFFFLLEAVRACLQGGRVTL